MSMSIYNNIPSMNSQNALRMNSGDLTKSLERLSSGLRINRASDDASGLAISEKMRGQIRGLDRAVSNAQDGISLIQTAEGALNETTSILQRMRELSVQAANGTYTSNDRQEIQKEVDQLKSEIDRISTSTEFNTKKLLNGDATARWSTSDISKMEAIVRDKVVTGNYKLDVTAKVGANQVQKSDIMTLKAGAMAGDILTAQGVVSAGGNIAAANASGIVGIKELEGVRTGDIDERTYRVNVVAMSVGGSFGMGTSVGKPADETHVSSLADTMAISGYYQQTGSSWSVKGLTGTGTSRVDFAPDTDKALVASTSAGVGGTFVSSGVHGYVELEFQNDIQVNSAGGSSGEGTTAVRARFIDVKTGEAGAWADVAVTDTGVVNIGAAGISGWDTSGDVVANIFDTGAALYLGTGDKTVKGDKVLLTVDDALKNSLTGDATDGGTMSIGAGAVKIDERFDDGATGAIREFRGAYYVATAANGLQNTVLTAGPKDINYHIAQLDEKTGSMTIGKVTLEMKANQEGVLVDDALNMEFRGTSGLASAYTKLSDIESFITPDGTSVFGVSQKMTLYGNGKQVDVYLEAADTIGSLVDKFKTAITSQDKGLGISMKSAETDNMVAQFIGKGSGVSGTDAAVEGTILLRSLFNGAQGEISLVADQKLLDALNLSEIQAAKENVYSVNVTDAHTGRPIGQDTVGDGLMENVIQGVDVAFKGNIGITASYNSTLQKFEFTAESTPETMYLHLVDNSINFQIGANEGQTMNTSIGQMDVKALGLEDVLLVDQKLAQKAITKIDKSLGMVNSERAKLGAVSNRLDHTINSLSVAAENLQASESRIRDVDVAKEMSKFTSKQMLVQAAQSMLAQANALPQGLMQLLR